MRFRDALRSIAHGVGNDGSQSFFSHVSDTLACTTPLSKKSENPAVRLGPHICIVPVADPPLEAVHSAVKIARKAFGRNVRLGRGRALPPPAFDPTSNRAFVTALAQDVSAAHEECPRLLVVCSFPLVAHLRDERGASGKFPVLGSGSPISRVAVVSSGANGFPECREHFEKVVVHELGHTFGARHHPSDDETPCIMNTESPGHTSPRRIDEMPAAFCFACLALMNSGKHL